MKQILMNLLKVGEESGGGEEFDFGGGSEESEGRRRI